MADQKLSELTELAATPAVDDELYIRDVSEAAAAESKRITIANLLTAKGARVHHDANQTIGTASWTTLAFNSESYDNDVIHDTVTNNSRLTCKTAGKYLIVVNLTWVANATGLRWVGILLNGAGSHIAGMNAVSTGASLGNAQDLVTLYELGVNDYIEVQVYQNSGGNLVVNSAHPATPEFMMQRVG